MESGSGAALGATTFAAAAAAALGTRGIAEKGQRQRLRKIREEVAALQELQQQELGIAQVQMRKKAQASTPAHTGRPACALARGAACASACACWMSMRAPWTATRCITEPSPILLTLLSFPFAQYGLAGVPVGLRHRRV